jgi:amino acid adenylation domain-containing protein
VAETLHTSEGPRVATLTQALRLRASVRPERRAYTFLADGEEETDHLDYRELDERARAIAVALGRTCAVGDRALLLYPPGLDFVAAFFGCLYAGVIAVPAYPPRSPRMLPRLAAILEDSSPAVALSTSGAAARVAGWLAKEGSRALSWLATDEIPADQAAEWRDPELPDAAIAFLQYTSGSTSTPKGVMVSHGNLVHNQQVIAAACDHTADSVFVSWLPLYHDLGLIGNLLQATWVGAPCVLMSPVAFLQNPSRWPRAISRYRGTTSGGPNFAYELCLRKVAAAERERLDLSSWRVAFNGAEPVRATTMARFSDGFAAAGLRREALYPCYGLAEATLMVSGGRQDEVYVARGYDAAALAEHRAEPAGDPERARELVGSGRVLLDLRVAIVEPEATVALPEGWVGEIWVAGGSVARGYWNRPEESERTFGARLAGEPETWLRTGDLGFLDRGELFITGRVKDLIILRGRNHYPQDIELTAERAHPALRAGSGAAFSVEAEGEERLVVVYEVDRHAEALPEIAEAVRRAVAEEHEAVVHEIVLVPQGAVPKTTSGKIQRRACRDLYLAAELHPLGSSRLEATSEPEPAEGPLRDALLAAASPERMAIAERWLARAFARLARVDARRLDPERALTGLGLDSLVAVELKNAVEDEVGVALPIAGLLEGMSLREAALRIVDPVVEGATEPLEVVAGPAAGEHPLSWGQRALWFLHRLAPESAAYNIAGAARLAPGTDRAALARALQALVDRHPGLRATFAATPEGPVQRIPERADVALIREDARGWSEAELLDRLQDEAFRPFDLERGPIFRAALFEREEGDRLALAVHHVAADFWSLAVLVRELGTLYGDSTGAGLPEPALHYTDFARWQEKRLEGPWGDALWEHWRNRLAGASPLDLATDRPRPPAQTFRGAERRLRLGAQRSAGLQALAAAHGSTLFVALLAAWQALLGRHAAQNDFLVGSPTTGRSAPGLGGRLAGVVGYFVNLVALRTDLAGDPTVPELLARARGAAIDALEHADFPFARLAERLQPERDASRSPLAQTVIALQRSPAPELAPLVAWAVGEAGARLELGGLALESVPLASPAAQFDLTLLAAELDGDFALNLQFNTDLFDAVTAERMLARLAELLGSMMKNPGRRLSELDLLPAAERAQLLAISAAAPGHPDGTPVHRLVEAHAALWPGRLAVADAGESLTYGELNARANRLARRLAALGVGLETTVAVCLERSAALAVAQLAVLKAGAAYAPLDPAYPAERRDYMVADSGALVLIARGSAEAAGTAGVRVLAVEEGAAGDDPGNPDVVVDGGSAGSTAYVIYTSGSTGRPKGVQISHANLANLIAWVLELYALTPEDRAALVVSPSFDVSVWEIWSTLAAGASLHVPDEATRTSPTALVAWLTCEAITAGFFPTPLVEALLEEPWPAAARLRVLGCGGDRLRRAPRPGTPFRLLNLYGPAECTVVSIGGEVPASALPLEGDAPIGVPVPGAAIHLLGPMGEEMPLGVPGEIVIGGLGVGRGYLGRPALTAERFVPDPFAATPGARLYRTGDLGRFRADGAVDFLGRIDRQVKIRGVRIELGEVEAALATLPGVREAVAEARAFGAGAPVLVAWVVPRQGDPAALDVRELATALRRTLPETLIPTVLMPLAALPLTPNGKIDRRALPDPTGFAEVSGVAAGPRTAMEERLAGIWSALLGVARIGRGDGFFELGGHSLLAARMISRLHADLGVDLPLAELFASPTLAELAAAIERARGTAGPEAEPIPRVPRDGDLPLSFAQERLWFLQRLAATPAYNVPAFLRLRGPLDGAALRAALTGIARRHETLRTTFPEVKGEPMQRVHPAALFPLVEEDLTGASDPEAAARRRAGEEASRPFDLQAGPLARAILLRLAPGQHVLGLTLHHAVTDGWSTEILLRELTALYRGTELPAPVVQYADYAVWQRAAMTGEALATGLDHWRRRLQGAPTVLEMPADRPRPATQSFRGGLARLPLGADLSAALIALARSRGATPFMTLLAAFQALLGRMTGHDDLLIGAPAANRGRPEVEGLIGFFVNLLALRADLGGDPPFSALLDRLRRGALEDFAHDDFPFEKVVDAVAPGRDLSRAPLVQVVFALQPALAALELAPGLQMEVEEVHNGTSKFDLTLFVEEGPAGFEARAEYASDLFDAATAQRLLERLRVVLAGAAADPETPLSRLPLLTAAERLTLVTEWSASAPAAEPFQVQQRIAEWAARTPERPALVSGTETLTYGEINARANRLAHALIRLGVGPERVVAVCLERSPAAVVACLAALKAGAAYVPLDPVHPPERLAGMVADVDAAVVLTHEAVAARVDFPAPLLRLDRETFAGFPDTDPEVRPDPEGLAYVIFTSGSTGRPKGSGVRHAGLANLCAFYAATTGMGPEDRLSQIAAPGFDVAVGELWPTLVAGASLHFPPDETIVSPPRLLDWLTREGVTICFLPTPLMELVLDEPAAAALALRWFYTGGDRLTRRPPAAAAWKLWNIYGPSECTVVSTSWVVEPAEEGLPSIGVPVPGARVYLLDRAGELAPAGVPAELWVGGVPVGRGYLGRPELTAERFRPDPFGSAGARLYRTGDLARFRADGRLDYLGRLDHQVKIRGFRIELGEVEAALLALPQVREGVVVAREHAPGDKRLVAYVVGREAPPDAALLRDLLRRTLPEGMVPATFVTLPSLPLSANGKVDRKALPAPDWESAGMADSAPRPPRTMTEELLAGIWAELLGLERAGVDDDFFASGGHSLLAARLTGRVRAAFGVELPLAEVFAHPTIAGLAREIEQARQEEDGGALPAPPLVPTHRVGPLPLSFAQERLWFLDQLEAGGPLYNVPVAARLRGALDAGRLAAAWRGVVRRHEALRTTFLAVGGKPAQRVAAELTLDLERIELDEAAAFRRLDEEARRPFDLARGPLARALLIRLGADDHLLALTFHHTVADGASMEVLFRELSALYAGAEPAPPAVQYPDYTVWQRGWLQGEVLDAQLAFWRAELTPPPPPLDLTTDRPRPAAQTFRGGAVAVALPAALVRGVRALARRHGATTFMTLLAAWSAVLHHWSGSETIAIGTPVANRRPEVEGTIGFFVNILPLLTQPAAERAFDDLLARVRGRALGAYAHQDVPFERLVDALAPDRDLSRHPLFQVVLALEDGPGARLRLPGLETMPVPVHTGTAKFELTLALAGDGDGLAGGLEYNADLFDATTARRMAGNLTLLLAGVVDDAGREIADLPLLGPDEERQVLVDWNSTAAPFPRGRGLHELFATQAARTPDAPALIWGHERWTYRELDARAGRLARRLRRLGVGPEALVGIFTRRTSDMVTAMIAVMRAGGAYVPLDPAYPAERIALLLADTAAPVLITESALAGTLPPYGGEVVLLGEEAETRDERDDWNQGDDGLIDPDQTAYTIYTSGSTGLPKAILIRHSSAVAMIAWALAAYPAEAMAGMLASTSICFDISIFEIFAPLACGGTVILADDALALAELPAAGEVRLIDTVPSAMAELLRAGAVPPSVTIVNLAGEPLRRDLVSRVYELPHVAAVYNLYGPSEDTTFSTVSNPSRGEEREPTIGRPIANGRLYVLDRRLRAVPVGVPGEVWIAGEGLARGYLNRPELTADRFRPDPFAAAPGARLYRVGDLARYLPDGELEYLGRLDHQVKIRGFRVELGEIEAALDHHPAVREAAVIAREEGATRALLACVVPAAADEPAAGDGLVEELRRYLASRLPAYMVPAGFLLLPALPLTPNGKVDRKALARLGPEKRRADQGGEDGGGYVAPRNPIEELLAPLWEEVLGVAPVGVHDDFFALGGHSLLGVQLVSRVSDLFGVKLPVRALFHASTLGDLAERIAEEMAAGVDDDLLAELFTTGAGVAGDGGND